MITQTWHRCLRLALNFFVCCWYWLMWPNMYEYTNNFRIIKELASGAVKACWSRLGDPASMPSYGRIFFCIPNQLLSLTIRFYNTNQFFQSSPLLIIIMKIPAKKKLIINGIPAWCDIFTSNWFACDIDAWWCHNFFLFQRILIMLEMICVVKHECISLKL